MRKIRSFFHAIGIVQDKAYLADRVALASDEQCLLSRKCWEGILCCWSVSDNCRPFKVCIYHSFHMKSY